MPKTILVMDRKQTGAHWLGIPSIEITSTGRRIVAWFSGGPCEPAPDNRIYVQHSRDGILFSEPQCAVSFPGMRRAYDPCLWIDPTGALWMTYNVSDPVENYNSVEIIECIDPEAESLVWSAPKRFDFGLPFSMRLNKPLVTSSGRWVFPISWNRNPVCWPDCQKEELRRKWSDTEGILRLRDEWNERWLPSKNPPDRDWLIRQHMLQGVALTDDQGKSWHFQGAVPAPDWAIESMAIEKKNGDLLLWIRTDEGHIWESVSQDGGENWSPGYRTNIINPGSKFHIQALPDTRWLLINTPDPDSRKRLCAYLSPDEGTTWSAPLLIAEGENVSYPDAVERDGIIHCVYDRTRYREGAVCLTSFLPEEMST